jgi:hypothetical protein
MLADPAFDDAGDQLHRAGDVNPSGIIAGGGEGLGDVKPESAVTQPYQPTAMDRAIELTRIARQ